MNYISFSVYGDKPKYLEGALRNAEQIKRFYPDFTALFYLGDRISGNYAKKLLDRGAKLSYMRSSQISNQMMWRFLAIEHANANVVLVRDVDSRFSERETRAVKEWLKSDKLFHVMRDYPAHDVPIMGGMWGWKKPLKLGMFDNCVNWLRIPSNREQVDQVFLAELIWPQVKHSVMQHDSFFRNKYIGSIPFPDGDKTVDGSFVGEVFDEEDKPIQACRDARFVGKSAG
jgi:hypothetical protein